MYAVMYMYMGHPPPPSQGRRKVCKYGGSISRTMYFELGGFYLHSGQNLGEGPNAPSPLANLVPTALPSYHHSCREGSWRRRPPGRIDHKKGQGDGYGNNKKNPPRYSFFLQKLNWGKSKQSTYLGFMGNRCNRFFL